jgi:hypothetical protein
MGIKLEGRVAGPWVAELNQAWLDAKSHGGSRAVRLDLSDVTYADAHGKEALRRIVAESGAELLASTPWARFLAQEVSTDTN